MAGNHYSEEPVRFWSALPEPDHAQMALLVSQYNAAHSSRLVEYTNFSSPEKLFQALKQDDLPDLALIDSRWTGSLKEKLVPAEKILNQAGEMVRTMAESDTFKPIWDSCVMDEKAYIIPFSSETTALVLNASSFKKIPSTITLKQWGNISAYLKPENKKIWGIVLPFGWEEADIGQLWSNLAETYAATSNSTPRLKKGMAALNLWWNWANRSKILPLEPYSAEEDFSKGASWILLPREVADLKGKYAVRPLPGFKKPWGYLRVQALAFFKGRTGWDFANYLTDYQQLKYWAMNTPTVPVNKQVYLSPDYLQEISSDRPWMRTYIQAVFHSTPSCGAPSAPEKLTEIGKVILDSLRKKITEQEAIKKIESVTDSVTETTKG